MLALQLSQLQVCFNQLLLQLKFLLQFILLLLDEFNLKLGLLGRQRGHHHSLGADVRPQPLILAFVLLHRPFDFDVAFAIVVDVTLAMIRQRPVSLFLRSFSFVSINHDVLLVNVELGDVFVVLLILILLLVRLGLVGVLFEFGS